MRGPGSVGRGGEESESWFQHAAAATGGEPVNSIA